MGTSIVMGLCSSAVLHFSNHVIDLVLVLIGSLEKPLEFAAAA